VRSRDLLPVACVREVDPRADDVRERRPRAIERVAHDLEAQARLPVGVLGRVAVARDGRRPGDDHTVADRHGTREARDGLEGRVAGEQAPFHSGLVSRPVEALRQIDGWPGADAVAGVTRAGATLGMHGRDRPLPWASVTKLASALAVLVAAEEGIVELDEPAGPPGSTVRHLLAHAAGLPFEGRRPIARPRERRIYSNTGFELLGELVEQRAEMPFGVYLAEAVFRPLGTQAELRGDAGSGVVGTLEDLLALGRELLAPTVVAPETLAEACDVQFPGLDGVLPGFGRQAPNDWGLGFELRDEKSPHWTGTRNSPRTFGHFGRSGTFLWVDPEAALACACLAERAFGDWAKEAWPALSDAVLAEAAMP
jgi:CubicO group peptidase (beta-lactamase class C family)